MTGVVLEASTAAEPVGVAVCCWVMRVFELLVPRYVELMVAVPNRADMTLLRALLLLRLLLVATINFLPPVVDPLAN